LFYRKVGKVEKGKGCLASSDPLDPMDPEDRVHRGHRGKRDERRRCFFSAEKHSTALLHEKMGMRVGKKLSHRRKSPTGDFREG
jgi:hypothetical protein